jgi:hypothetical protein
MIVEEIEKNTKMIHIHNVYNSSLISYTSKNNSFMLSKIMRFIVETLDDHHILLKDFNLQHFFWSDSSRSTQHAATDNLLDIMQNRNLILILSRNSITWKTRSLINIINLTFMTIYLAKRLKHCMTRFNLDQSSNHIFISTKILCDEVEFLANHTQSMKTHWIEQDQKNDEARVHVTTFNHNSRNRHLCEWNTKISVINRRGDRIVSDF